MTVGVDLDFARYISERRGQMQQQARDGAAYAFSGERKVRRALVTARPVSMAIEATTRLWKNAAKNELLGTSVKVTDQQFPKVYSAVKQASAALGLDVPSVYVAPESSRVLAQALGTGHDVYIVVNARAVETFTDVELLALLGNELGHIQNNQVTYSTALFYLTHSAVMFVRWIVQPAIMTLQAWSRRAEITCDRAALLCTKDLGATLAAMVKISLGLERDANIDIDEYLKQLPDTKKGIGKLAELFRSHPYLPKRVQALRLFAESSYYQRAVSPPGERAEGLTMEEVDQQVSELLSVF